MNMTILKTDGNLVRNSHKIEITKGKSNYSNFKDSLFRKHTVKLTS